MPESLLDEEEFFTSVGALMRAVGKKISKTVKAWSGCKNTCYQQKLFKILLLIFDRTTGKILVKDFGSEKQLQTVEKFRILC